MESCQHDWYCEPAQGYWRMWKTGASHSAVHGVQFKACPTLLWLVPVMNNAKILLTLRTSHTELEVQTDRINEQMKENKVYEKSQVLTKIHVPAQESLYLCTCVSLLSGL